MFGRAIAGVLDTASVKLRACSMKLSACLVERLLGYWILLVLN